MKQQTICPHCHRVRRKDQNLIKIRRGRIDKLLCPYCWKAVNQKLNIYGLAFIENALADALAREWEVSSKVKHPYLLQRLCRYFRSHRFGRTKDFAQAWGLHSRTILRRLQKMADLGLLESRRGRRHGFYRTAAFEQLLARLRRRSRRRSDELTFEFGLTNLKKAICPNHRQSANHNSLRGQDLKHSTIFCAIL